MLKGGMVNRLFRESSMSYNIPFTTYTLLNPLNLLI